MAFKFTKGLAFVLAFVMVILVAYTIVVGARLWYCSSCIIDSEQYMSRETANKVYSEMNNLRASIARETEFANILCNASGIARLLLLIAEIAIGYVSGMLWYIMSIVERRPARRQARRGR